MLNSRCSIPNAYALCPYRIDRSWTGLDIALISVALKTNSSCLVSRINISWSEYLTFCDNLLVFITSSGLSFTFKHSVRDRSWLLADTLGEDDYAISLYFATNTCSGSSLGLLANLSRYFCFGGFGRIGLFYLRFFLGPLEHSASDFGIAVRTPKVLFARHSKLRVKPACWW